MPSRSHAFVATLLLLILLPPAGQAQTALPPATIVTTKFPPYMELSAEDQPIGPGVDFVRRVAARAGQTPAIRMLPWARALLTAESDANTLIFMIARTPERETRFHWVCGALEYDVMLFRRSDRIEVAPRNPGDLRSWHIASARQDVKTNYLKQLGVRVEETDDEDAATRLLVHGRIDLTPAHPPTLHHRLRLLGLPPERVTPVMPLPALTSRLYLAFGANSDPKLVHAYREACDDLIRSGESIRLLKPDS